MDTPEIDEPIDLKTQQMLDEITARVQESAVRIKATSAEANKQIDIITQDVDTTIAEIESSMKELDQADEEAGDQLDVLMMETAEDLAN
jgi:hypothetical protein